MKKYEVNKLENKMFVNQYLMREEDTLLATKLKKDASIENLSMLIKKRLNCYVLASEGDEVFVFNKELGIYKSGNQILERIIAYILEEKEMKWSSKKSNEIIRKLSIDVDIVERNSTNKVGFAFRNKTILTEGSKVEVVDHSPDYYLTQCSPVTYDSEATCPSITNFLNQIQGDKTTIENMIQWLGYQLTSNAKPQNLVFATGCGSNGKSVWWALMAALLGEVNVSNSTLENISSRFGKQILLGKKANISFESDSAKFSSGILKELSSGDSVNIDRKNKTEISQVLTTKLTFVTNQLPILTDLTHGWERRVMIIPFNVTFTKEQQDRDLLDKLKVELSGLLNLAIAGLDKLIQNEYKFIESEEMKKQKEQYFKQGNPVRGFVEKFLEQDNKGRCYKNDILAAYEEFLEENGIAPSHTKAKFWGDFATNMMEIHKILDGICYSRDKNGYFLKGFKLKK
ncbi:phage/plasmid primase, P4 family [Carnobacterium maltaromaticum]|uniref:DNA primase family protein n=1 Tax=Carnobacterium maltaromaticum TaxID=2751 RepID=UPI0012FC5E72|nr:DNA primase family protein [Carnobacterium maltaromaticum]